MTELMPDIISRADAKARGLKFYFTEKSCPKGHIAKKRVSSRNCVICEIERSREYKKNNRDRVNEYAAERYAKNPDRVREIARNWYARNGRGNPEKLNEYAREWRSKNVDKQNFYSARRYARKIAAIPEIRTDLEPMFRSEILAIYAEARMTTELTGVRHDVDHIFPISKGGVHAPWNLRVLIGSENQSKKDKWPKGEPIHVMWHGELMSRLIGNYKET